MAGKRNSEIVRFEVDGVLARLTLKQSKSEELKARLTPLVRLVAAMAGHVRARMLRGETGDQHFAGYSAARGSGARISNAYASLLGVQAGYYATSRGFHHAARTTPGSFHVTGGMWRGMGVRGVGTDAAQIEFTGKSEGRGKVVKIEITPPKGGRSFTVRRVQPERVANRLKAATVLGRFDVHVLAPTEPEQVAVAERVAVSFGRVLEGVFGAARVSGFDSDPRLRQTLARL